MPGTSQVPGTRCQVPGAGDLVLSTNTRCQVPGTRYQIPGTRYLAPGILKIPGFQILDPGWNSRTLMDYQILDMRIPYGFQDPCGILDMSISLVASGPVGYHSYRAAHLLTHSHRQGLFVPASPPNPGLIYIGNHNSCLRALTLSGSNIYR